MSTPFGKDLARSQGTDFYGTDDLLTDDERAVRDRVRTFVDDRLVPAAPGYWGAGRVPPGAGGDGGFSTFHSVHSGPAMTTIALLGSEEQKQRWLPDLAACTTFGAFALTEPEHGSDVVRMATTARRDGRHWVLDGAKRWIGLGTLADVVVVWARDDDGDVGAFVVDHGDGRPPATTPR